MAVTDPEVEVAVATIKTLHADFHTFKGAQVSVNEAQARVNDKVQGDIEELKIDSERKNGDLKLILSVVGRIEKKLDGTGANIRSWIGTVTPWAIIILGLAYFYVTNKGGTP